MQPPEVFCKKSNKQQKQSRRGVFEKSILRNFAKSTGKQHMRQTLFFNKNVGLRHNLVSVSVWESPSGVCFQYYKNTFEGLLQLINDSFNVKRNFKSFGFCNFMVMSYTFAMFFNSTVQRKYISIISLLFYLLMSKPYFKNYKLSSSHFSQSFFDTAKHSFVCQQSPRRVVL